MSNFLDDLAVNRMPVGGTPMVNNITTQNRSQILRGIFRLYGIGIKNYRVHNLFWNKARMRVSDTLIAKIRKEFIDPDAPAGTKPRPGKGWPTPSGSPQGRTLGQPPRR
jgi:hypothetical protein